MIKLKRTSDPPSRTDGFRVLVDRLWPRGMRKEALPLDEWEKQIAPSDELRRWFGHDPARWSEFRQRYRRELKRKPASELVRRLAEQAERDTVTLLFSSHDAEHNNAVVLRDVIEGRRVTPAADRTARTPGRRSSASSTRTSQRTRAPRRAGAAGKPRRGRSRAP
jgi:uncharacterized protein YeaO (DUF488 family)